MRLRGLMPALMLVAACGLLADLIAPTYAFAYLDPGTGSLVFQWIIGGIVAGGFVIKMFGRRVLTIFRRSRSDDSESDG